MSILLRSFQLCLLIFFTNACQQKTTPGTASPSPTEPKQIESTDNPSAVVARVAGKEITESMVLKGIENSVYEAEKKIYDLKMINLRNIMLDTVIALDTDKKGITKEAYLAQYVTSDITVSDEDVSAFIKERKIATQKLDESLKNDIKQYLYYQKKDAAIDAFIKQRSGSEPVEIYLKEPKEPVFVADLAGAPTLGPETAAVTIIEYSDFQCPYCKKGAEVLGQIREKFGDQVRIIFKHFPLPMHRDARIAAEAGVCAYSQGNSYFWKMHDQMFDAQNKLTKPELINSADEIGLDKEEFIRCLDSGEASARVAIDLNDGANAKVRATPTFFINGKHISGLKQFEEFSQLVDEALTHKN